MGQLSDGGTRNEDTVAWVRRSVGALLLVGALAGCPSLVPVGWLAPRDAGAGPDGGACVPQSCAAQGLECGFATDTCGQRLDCGSCGPRSFCGGPRGPATCCQPRSCAEAHHECGVLDDGCGHQLTCGTCSSASTCGGSGLEGVCGTPQCTADGWCWEQPVPVGQNLNDVFAVSGTLAWAVGGDGDRGGAIARWDGVAWRNVTPEPMAGVTGVWASGPDDAWFTLIDGSVRHFDGTGWSTTVVAPSHRLTAVSGSSPTDVWVVGNEASAHFDGQTWRSLPLDPQVFLADVVSFGPTDAWAVGQVWTSPTDGGWPVDAIALHSDGSGWVRVGLPPTPQAVGGLQNVWGSGGADVWLGGGPLLHWDGAAVSSATGPNLPAPWNAGGAPNGEVWAVSSMADSPVARLDGGVWTSAGTALPRRPLGASYVRKWAVAGTAADDVWLAGPAGVIEHWDGRTLAPASRSFGIANLNAVDGTATDLWVATQDGALHSDGTRWTPLIVNQELSDVFGLGDGKALAISGDGVLEYDGTVWTVAQPCEVALKAMHGSSPVDVWAVGLHGAALHLGPTGWARADLPATDDLSDVFVLSPTDAWAVAATTGTAWHWTGSAWTSFATQATGAMAVWASGPSDAWAVDGTHVFHWDGAAWSQVVGLPAWPVTPSAISGTGPRDVWVTGGLYYASAISYHGATAHFDGTGWSIEDLGEDRPVKAVLATATDVWAVGLEGMVLRRRR